MLPSLFKLNPFLQLRRRKLKIMPSPLGHLPNSSGSIISLVILQKVYHVCPPKFGNLSSMTLFPLR
jgi:hypothetical protein